MTKLSVNINKIATLRNSRGVNYPDLIKMANHPADPDFDFQKTVDLVELEVLDVSSLMSIHFCCLKN